MNDTITPPTEKPKRKKAKTGAVFVAFRLAMPGCGSWDGQWSGQNRNYVIVRKFSGPEGRIQADAILAGGSYSYRWDDGWAARVTVKEVTSQEANGIKRLSDGFAGYDWMIDSICDKGRIVIE